MADRAHRRLRVSTTITLALLALLILGSALRGTPGVATAGQTQQAGTNRTAGRAPEGTVFFLDREASLLIARAMDDGRMRGTIPLRTIPQAIVPTPGGVTLYLLWSRPEQAETRLEAFDVLTLERQVILEPEVTDVEGISFSPQGRNLYLAASVSSGDDTARSGSARGDSDELHVYDHRRLTIEAAAVHPVPPGDGAVISDRRGTYLYRPAADGISVIYARTGEETDHIAVDGEGWRIDADYRAIWGKSPEGHPVTVDPREGSVTTGDEEVSAGPAVTDEAVWYLTEGGTALVGYTGTSGSAEERLSVRLPRAASHLVGVGDDTVWAVTEDGSVFVIANRTVVDTLDAPGRLAGAVTVSAVVAAEIQQNGSFACF